MTKQIQIKSLETGSGITWEEWLKLLAPHKELSHGEIAKIALEHIEAKGVSKSPGWWAQGVTVAFEQHIGRRKPGQVGDGSYSVTVTKTFSGDMDEVLAVWIALTKAIYDFDGIVLKDKPRISKTEKWRYWRCSLEDGSNVSVNIQTKSNGTSSLLAINQDKLSDSESVERARAFWKQYLEKARV